jgi:hypothetical protein
LPEHATSAGEQEIAARSARDETSAALVGRLTKLEPFIAALHERVTLALAFALGNGSDSDAAAEVSELARLLAAVGAEMAHAHEIGPRLRPFTLLAQNRNNHSDPAEVDKAASELAAELQKLTGGIQERLKQFTYPFPHARGQLTVAEYARSEKTAETEWERAYLDSDAHLDRLFALNYRLIGRVLAHADAGEQMMEKAVPATAP